MECSGDGSSITPNTKFVYCFIIGPNECHFYVSHFIIIDEVFFEELLPYSPVISEILGEEGCYYHTETIMHPIGLYELSDSRINEWIPCFSLFELFILIRLCIFFPLYCPSAFLELDIVCEWKIIRNLIPELSPDYL